MGSSSCEHCLRNMYTKPRHSFAENAWRHNRLLRELRSLHADPLDEISALPLDVGKFRWQAIIDGPTGSPYENGRFLIYLEIPLSYPMNPPIIRFITKIIHPNISFHGDVGLDSLQHNWSLALTIPKLLISVQSLLTDPNYDICMEQSIGKLYSSNLYEYNRRAKFTTHCYAINKTN